MIFSFISLCISFYNLPIWIGQYIGTAIVIGASLLVAQGVVNLIPQQWVIGLLGLLPLYLGVKMWIKGDEDEDESSILSLFSSGKFNQLFLTMTFIVLASSADDFSIYIPYFTTLNMSEIFIAVIVFLIIEFAGEKTHYFNGGMIARRRTVRM